MSATVSSHLLNGADGTHAGGVTARLLRSGTRAVLFEAKTDAGGRLVQAVDLSGADPGDLYELVFETRAYWAARGETGARVIPEIVLRFTMPDPTARYHSPVILSPHGYSVWSSQAE